MRKESEHLQSVYRALGSCVDLDTEIMVSADLGYIDQSRAIELSEKVNYITRALCNLIKKT